MYQRISTYFKQGHQRSVKAKKNIVSSLVVKFFDAVIDFALVPISLAYLTQTEYGTWLTISSMVAWLNLFDFGISHGFRNKLSIALSDQNLVLAKEYTSTAYFAITILSLILGIFGLAITPFINWASVLNVELSLNQTLVYIVEIIIASYAISLILKIITSVFLANQNPFLSHLVHTISKALTLVILFFILKTGTNDITSYAIVFSCTPLVVLFLSSLFFFSKKYNTYSPSIKSIRTKRINEIMGLGVKFFVIQISVAILFMSDNLIIAHVLSPADVATYQITQKYFSAVLIIFTTITTPFWSAITDAYAKNETQWIKRSIQMLIKVWVASVFITIGLSFVFDPFLTVWLQNQITVPKVLVLQSAIFIILQTHNIIYTTFLNGIGKISIQMFTAIFTIFANIPLSIFFAKTLEMGSAGVLLATNLSILLYIVTRRIQYHKIISNNAHGIWNR